MFRLVFHFSKWSNKKCQAICSAYGSDGGLLFSIKAILKDNPFFILGCSMMTSIVVFALALRIFERPYNIDKIDNGQDFEYI